jgi:hypothetical protein
MRGEIDISGNKLGVKDINYIAEILTVNKSISSLVSHQF